MGKLAITPLKLKGTFLVETDAFEDNRGVFARFFCQEELKKVLGERQIANINFSKTTQKGAVRGLHYQKQPYAEMKMVRCIRGKVLDVFVDIRKKSPTFLQWDSVELSEEKRCMIVIPEGFAHGFQTLEENSELLYLHTNYYNKESEAALNINDKELNIKWPLPISNISERDKNHPLLTNNFKGIEL